MWYTLPYVLTIISIVIIFITNLALLYPTKSPEKVLQCRLRMGICLILKVALSIYTALLDSGIETKEIGCSIGLVIVHTLLVTGTVWMFLEVLNGAYSAAGLEGRIKGIGLNKIVAGLHIIPFLVFFVSIIYTLVEHKDATTFEIGGVTIRNGSRNDDGSNCWIHPITYWVTWNLPAAALFLMTCCTLIYIAHHCNVKWRALNCCCKGDEEQWIRHTFFTTLLFCALIIAASFADAETSSNKMMQQSLFSLFIFLFSISTFYCWVVSPPEIYFFWAGLRENVSLPCLTCGWCVLEYQSEKSRSPMSVNSSMFVNTNMSGPVDVEALSLNSSVCSGDNCRHVNQKCVQGRTCVAVVIDDHLTSSDPEIAGTDRKKSKPEYVDPEIFGIDRKKERTGSKENSPTPRAAEEDDILSDDPGTYRRIRRTSKVSFNDFVEFSKNGLQTPELTLITADIEIKPIYCRSRSSSGTTSPSIEHLHQHDDTPIPSPEDDVPVSSEPDQDPSPAPPGPVRYLSTSDKTCEDSPTDSEKATKLRSVVEKRVTVVTHAVVMEELLSEVGESNVYQPQKAESETSSNFAEHLQKLMADYEKTEASLSRSSSQNEPDSSTVPPPDTAPSSAPQLDILYPLRVSSSESSTPTIPDKSGDEFATPPEGRTPEAENSSETQPTQQPTLSPDSPLDVFKPVFGDP